VRPVTDLEAALAAVTAEFPAAGRLALDAWEYGRVHGDAAGVRYAAHLLGWLRESAAARAADAAKWGWSAAARPAGAVRGAGPVPADPAAWVLTGKGRVVRKGEHKAADGAVTHWARDGWGHWHKAEGGRT
jgi:hypothetical protein